MRNMIVYLSFLHANRDHLGKWNRTTTTATYGFRTQRSISIMLLFSGACCVFRPVLTCCGCQYFALAPFLAFLCCVQHTLSVPGRNIEFIWIYCRFLKGNKNKSVRDFSIETSSVLCIYFLHSFAFLIWFYFILFLATSSFN